MAITASGRLILVINGVRTAIRPKLLPCSSRKIHFSSRHSARFLVCQTEIYKLVKNGQGSVPFRPTLINPTLGEAEEYGDGCSSEELVTTVKRCWAEDPAERPDFHALKTIIKRINKYDVS